ncbi:MAG: ATP-dependent helicase [Cytophagaceae bacterium]
MPTTFDQAFQKELDKLNDAQRQAVEHIEGPVLVIAGPGTGKTQILSARIGHILSSSTTHAQAHNILCLTYTDAGTVAMRKRLLKFIGPEAYRVHIYTFHAFCNQVIQENLDFFGFRELQPVTELESVLMFKELIDGFPASNPLKRYTGDAYFETGRLKTLFDVMKKENWTADFIRKKSGEYLDSLPYREDFIYKRANSSKGIKAGDVNTRKVKEEEDKINLLLAAADEFDKFESMMRKKRRYDYNDMILWVLNAFRNNDDLLRRYQEQYLYILVDEYQDTNGAQNEIINLLTSFWDVPNIFVVGDDDQSIYRFQGASIKNIIDFYDRFKASVKTIVLTENYRSCQDILNSSGGLISYNKERLVNKLTGLSKDLTSKGIFSSEYKGIVVREFNNITQEETSITEEIVKLKESGENLSEIAVLYRSHKLVENIVKVLELKGIPLNIKLKTDILKLPFIESVINVLTYVQQEYKKPDSAEYLLYELMHYSYFNISPRDIAAITRYSYESGQPWREIIESREKLFRLNLHTASAVSELEENLSFWINNIPNLTLQGLFEKIITRGGIMSYIMSHEDQIWLMQVLNTFFDFIKEETAKNPSMSLEAFLLLIREMKTNNIPLSINKVAHAEEGINFITAHSSKGLEFKHVFMIKCTSGNWEKQRSRSNTFRFPDTLNDADTEDTTEEERRLFYVAMTRAKENLYISYSLKDNSGKDLECSRFVAEILEHSGLKPQQVMVNEKAILIYQQDVLAGEVTPQIELKNQEFIKDVIKNYKMSVTHLNKYLKCPLSFYFENILRVPSARSESMGFGNAMHYALFMLFSKMTKDPEKRFPGADDLYSYFTRGMDNHKSHFTQIEYDRKMEFGKELLYDYYAKYSTQWNKVVSVEYRIANAEAGGVPITGALDKIEFNGKQVNVVDYKTGNPENGKRKLIRPSEKHPLGGDYWRQIVFYKILLDADKTKSYEMVSGEIDFLQKNDDGEFVKEKLFVTPDDILIVKQQIKETYSKIMNFEFTTGCNESDCQWCKFVKFHYRYKELSLQDSDD